MACQLTCNIIWLVVSFWFSIHRNGWSVMIIPTGMFFHAFRKCLETSSHFLFKSAPTFRSSPLAGEEDGRSICSRLLFYRWRCCAVRVTASQCHSVTAVSMTGCHSQNGQSWTERRKKIGTSWHKTMDLPKVPEHRCRNSLHQRFLQATGSLKRLERWSLEIFVMFPDTRRFFGCKLVNHKSPGFDQQQKIVFNQRLDDHDFVPSHDLGTTSSWKNVWMIVTGSCFHCKTRGGVAEWYCLWYIYLSFF